MGETNNVSTILGGEEEEPSWAELLGSKNWDGLLNPLNLTLRRFLLRCGDFCEAAGDAFNGDTSSPYFGTCRYGPKSFFRKVKFAFAADYNISSLLYATSTLGIFFTIDKKTHYMGFVAVSTNAATNILGRREIYVVWRGTKTRYEEAEDFKFYSVPATPLLRSSTPTPPKIMRGWLDMYTASNPSSEFTNLSARDQVRSTVKQLLEVYKDENPSVLCLGHSMGASLAVVSAFDLVENDVAENIPVTAVVFACPNVGDAVFAEWVQKYPNLKILHTKNSGDPVPHLPPVELGYRPVGVEITMDGTKAPDFKKGMSEWHDLMGMMHVLSGWHGDEEPFEVVVERSLALANKTTAFLNDDVMKENNIPGTWWVVENKGMGINDKGEWALIPPFAED